MKENPTFLSLYLIGKGSNSIAQLTVRQNHYKKSLKALFMKKTMILITIISILFLLSNCKNRHTDQISANAQATASIKAEIERILKVQEDAYMQNNEDGMRKLAATCVDSLMFVNEGGIMTSAYKWSHDMDNGYIERPHDKTFQFYNNVVLVSYIDKSYYLMGSDTIYLDNRITKTFLKINDIWKMISLCLSRCLVNYTKPSHGNAALYPDYVGIYKLSSTVADTVILINGELRNENGKTKLYPLNDSTFMTKEYQGKNIFSKNARGKVTHQIYEFPDGQRFRIPKVK
jgi:hypothetical protein